MDKNLQQWVLNGAIPPTPVEYDLEHIRQLCRRHHIDVLFYLGDLPDLVLEETKGFIRKLAFLDNNLNVYARYDNKDDIVVKDYKYLYSQIQGEKQINFINYSEAQQPNMNYIANELWKRCYDGSVVVIKNASTLLSGSGRSVESIKTLFNSFESKNYYDVRLELDQIIIEKA